MRFVWIGVVVATFLCGMTAKEPRDANPVFLELNRGDSIPFKLANGETRSVKLIGHRELTEPYFESVNKQSIQALIAVEITVEVDGVKESFTGGPFRMPVSVNGVALLLNCTRNWTGGIHPDPLSKEVRLEVRDASLPWYTENRFRFPVRNYRWRIMNYQHTYLGIAVNQARLYYHRGEDFGMIPDLEQTLSMTAARVLQIPGPAGDGDSNYFSLEDPAGLQFWYAHMNAPQIDPSLRVGDLVAAGQKLGLTGNTWQGRPVEDPHLHLEVRDRQGEVFRNTFPLIVSAFRQSFPDEPMPVAGGWRHVFQGESLVLDGSLSLAAKGIKLTDFQWTFTDSAKASDPRVKRTYKKGGAYSEQLMVKDNRGRSDLDFVEVFVLARDQKIPPPYAWINYYPVRGIQPGTPVRFLIRHSNMKAVTVDYGDGGLQPWAENSNHSYHRAGTYIVTVRGEDAGAGPGLFHARVIVEE